VGLIYFFTRRYIPEDNHLLAYKMFCNNIVNLFGVPRDNELYLVCTLWSTGFLSCGGDYAGWQDRRQVARRDSVQLATEPDWLTRARDCKRAERYKTRPPSYLPATLAILALC
jgi:hypothetical protein